MRLYGCPDFELPGVMYAVRALESVRTARYADLKVLKSLTCRAQSEREGERERERERERETERVM